MLMQRRQLKNYSPCRELALRYKVMMVTFQVSVEEKALLAISNFLGLSMHCT